MEKVALFAFNGDPMCFVHVLLNALDWHEKGSEVRVVIEGSATRLIPEFQKPGHPLHALYDKASKLSLLHGVCRACAGKMGTLEAARGQGLALLDDMSGHPGIASFTAQGFRVLTF